MVKKRTPRGRANIYTKILQQMDLLILAPAIMVLVSAVIEPFETSPLEPPQNLTAGRAAPETLLAPGMTRQSKPLTSVPVFP